MIQERNEAQIFVLGKYGMTVAATNEGERLHIPYKILVEWADKIKENYSKLQKEL